MITGKMSDADIEHVVLERKRYSEILDDDLGVPCDQALFDRLEHALRDFGSKNFKYDGKSLFLYRMNSEWENKIIKASKSHLEIIKHTAHQRKKADQKINDRTERSKTEAQANLDLIKRTEDTAAMVKIFLAEKQWDTLLSAQPKVSIRIFDKNDPKTWLALSLRDAERSRDSLQDKLLKLKNNIQ